MSEETKAWDIKTYSKLDIEEYPKNEEYNFTCPQQIRLNCQCDDDTQILDTTTNKWKFYYLGRSFLIDWNRINTFPSFLFNLVRSFIVYRLNVSAPTTAHSSYEIFIKFFHNLQSLSLADLLKVSHEIFTCDSKRDSCSGMVELLQFYRWGYNSKIKFFSYKTLIILESLPRVSKNPFESIFLNQNYVSSEDERQFLIYLNNCLESIDKVFSSKQIIYDEKLIKKLQEAVILSLAYEVAPRPSQIYLLNSNDFKTITSSKSKFYEIRFKLLKQKNTYGSYTSFRSLTTKTGRLIEKLIHYNHLYVCGYNEDSPLFIVSNENFEGKRLSTLRIQAYINECEEHTFTFTLFRHHLAQCLADQGASEEIIADRMGQTCLASARAYIASTPKIAEIKNKALGTNQTYLELNHSFMTGEIINSQELQDSKDNVRGTIGGSGNLKYISKIGACDASGSCPYDPIYSCYTCKKFHPFIDGDHEEVAKTLRLEALNFVDSTVDLQHSRPVTQLEKSIAAVDAVIKKVEELPK